MSAEQRDANLLFATRSLRLLLYGYLSVILAVYLAGLGLSADLCSSRECAKVRNRSEASRLYCPLTVRCQ